MNSPRLAFLLRVFDSRSTRVCFIALKHVFSPTSKNTYSKCIYFFPTCRQAGKVDDPCITVNLEKSLSSRVDIHILEAFNNFREDFQKSLQKQWEVDQTSSSAHKTNAPSKDLDKPSNPVVLSSHWRWSSPLKFLDSYSSLLVDDSGQVRSSAKDPSKVASTKPKQASHSSRYHVVDPSSALDHYSDYSIDPQPAPGRPKAL